MFRSRKNGDETSLAGSGVLGVRGDMGGSGLLMGKDKGSLREAMERWVDS